MNYIDVAASRELASRAPQGIDERLWRRTLSNRIETHLALATALLSVLDGMDGDCDLESYLAGAADDLEGGDVQDEPHDETSVLA